MATVKDVARYILEKKSGVSAIKLQKLVYYCQAWSLVWDEAPLFQEEIQAWANGPVVPDLFYAHKGQFYVDCSTFSEGDISALTKEQKETIDAVINGYGDKSAQWLVDLTHLEEPWKVARGDCNPGERCKNVITHASMAEYYSGL